MAFTETGIAFPEVGEGVTPLEGHFGALATTADAAIRGRGTRVYRVGFGQQVATGSTNGPGIMWELARFNVPDPGFAYTVKVDARSEISGVGRIDLRVTLNGSQPRFGYWVRETEPKYAMIVGDGWAQPLTGDSLVIIQAIRVTGTGAFGSFGSNNYMTLTVSPHPEAAA